LNITLCPILTGIGMVGVPSPHKTISPTIEFSSLIIVLGITKPDAVTLSGLINFLTKSLVGNTFPCVMFLYYFLFMSTKVQEIFGFVI